MSWPMVVTDTPDTTSTLTCADPVVDAGLGTTCTLVPKRSGVPIHARASDFTPAASAGSVGALAPAVGTSFTFAYSAPATTGPVSLTTSPGTATLTVVDTPNGSADFGAPDGLWFDQFGRLWIQTDQQGDAGGDWVNIGANVMVCADPTTREIRRFMTSPRNCEVTGVVNTPDGKTMFVGIQHPGEDSPAANPTLFSRWPQSQFAVNSAGESLARDGSNNPLPVGANVRPRSSVLVITREDGGVIGA